MRQSLTKRELTDAIENYGMRGMTITDLNCMVADHFKHAKTCRKSAAIFQAAKNEIFIKRAIGAE